MRVLRLDVLDPDACTHLGIYSLVHTRGGRGRGVERHGFTAVLIRGNYSKHCSEPGYQIILPFSYGTKGLGLLLVN